MRNKPQVLFFAASALCLLIIGSSIEVADAAGNAAKITTPIPNAAPIENDDRSILRKGYSRLVVIGDLHGDLNQALRTMLSTGIISLQPNYYSDLKEQKENKTPAKDSEGHPAGHKTGLTNYINANMLYNKRGGIMMGSNPDGYHWAGGKTLVVCTGDAMNVGPQDLDIIRFVMRLTREAKAAGGHFEFLLGNHEMRNLGGDFDGVHPWSFEQSGGASGRKYLLSPKTDFGQFLRHRKVLFLWNEWIFMHGGMWPLSIDHIKKYSRPFNPSTFVDKVNEAVITMHMATTDKEAKKVPSHIRDLAEVFINVDYKTNALANPLLIHPLKECNKTHKAIAELGGVVRAMIVGHTPHRLPQFAFCDGELFAVDFGNSKWKTGHEAAVASVIIGPPEEEEQLKKIAQEDETRYYENKRTLGTWTAALVITTADMYFTDEEVNRSIRFYQFGLVALALITLFLLYKIVRKSRLMGGRNQHQGGGGKGTNPLSSEGTELETLAVTDEQRAKKAAAGAREPYGTMTATATPPV